MEKRKKPEWKIVIERIIKLTFSLTLIIFSFTVALGSHRPGGLSGSLRALDLVSSSDYSIIHNS